MGYFRTSINLRGFKVEYKNNTNANFNKLGLFVAHIHKFQ